MQSMTYSVGVSLESGFSCPVGTQRGLLDVNDAVSCLGGSAARCMDTVFCVQFSFVIDVWSLTLVIGKSLLFLP